VPGLPGILIGHNARIAWSLTDTQNQATMFYDEKTRPGEYYWDGAWRKLQVVHYTIAVRGAATRHLTVDITVHGPIMTQAGQTTSIDWMGNVPSPDLQAMLTVNQAASFSQFKAVLAGWYAPTQNFVYADATGNIGAISAGYYPQVGAGCQPWLPITPGHLERHHGGRFGGGLGLVDILARLPVRGVPALVEPGQGAHRPGSRRPGGLGAASANEAPTGSANSGSPVRGPGALCRGRRARPPPAAPRAARPSAPCGHAARSCGG
jgi:acyl-homoserine lactone acylase PvdQ